MESACCVYDCASWSLNYTLASPPLPSPFPSPLPSQLEAAQKRCAALGRSVGQVDCDSDVSEFVTAAGKSDEYWPQLIVYATPEQSEVGMGFPLGRAFTMSDHNRMWKAHCPVC